MKILFRALIVISSVSIWAIHSQAKAHLEACESRPEALARNANPILWSQLPAMIYVAQSADYYLENKNEVLGLWSHQSFLDGSSRFICGKIDDKQVVRASMYAPTFLDLTGEKKIVSSYWQFQMIANSRLFGIWNQKSRIFAKSKEFPMNISRMGLQIQFFQISNSLFEMQLRRENDSQNETLIVRFEAVSRL